jgi:hypothetical protein
MGSFGRKARKIILDPEINSGRPKGVSENVTIFAQFGFPHLKTQMNFLNRWYYI